MDKEQRKQKTAAIRTFVLHYLCQNCVNEKCNSQDVMEKYMTDDLSAAQRREINYFDFDPRKAACRNYRPPEEEVFGHFIKIKYFDGTIKRIEDLCALSEISKIWRQKDVEDIKIVWTDVF